QGLATWTHGHLTRPSRRRSARQRLEAHARDVMNAQALTQALPGSGKPHASGGLPPIAIDEVTAGLLDARLEVVGTAAGLWLHGEQVLAKGTRTLLGMPTTCVGRDWEIATLEGLLEQCIEESSARAVLVTGPAGMGKSRIAYELLRRVP